MLSLAIDVCKAVIDLITKNKEIKSEEKLKISEILEEISKVLLDTADKLSKDEYPHYNCAILEKLSEHLHFSLLDYIPQEQLDELYTSLKNA